VAKMIEKTQMITFSAVSEERHAHVRRSRRTCSLGGLAMLVTVLAISVAPAGAATPAVAWKAQMIAEPTNFQPSDSNDNYVITLTNVGSQASSGTITVVDTLPPGVTTSATPSDGSNGVFTCTPGAGQTVVTCTSSTAVPALAQPWGTGNGATAIFVPVSVSAASSGAVTNQVQVSGGGASGTATAATTTPITPAAEPFSLLDFTSSALDASGSPDTQAGDHPAALYTAFDVPSANVETAGGPLQDPVEDPRQVVIDLPAGLVGNPQAAPRCTEGQLATFGGCPPGAQVGEIGLLEPLGASAAQQQQPGAEANIPVYNVVPERGYPAEFGLFEPLLQRPVYLFASVVGGGAGAHLRITSQPLPQSLVINGESATFYGDPAVQDGTPNSPIAFFTNPADCGAPGFTTTIHVDTWQNPGRFNPDGTPDFSDPNWKSASSIAPPVTGCNQLQFSPTLSVQPDVSTPDSPAGVNVDLQVPQNSDPNGLATPPLRDATVTLPAGVAVSPSAANGLEGCTDAQAALDSNTPANCPDGSDIGTVDITTPVLADHLTGQIYLMTPQCSPCTNADAQDGSMLRGFIQASADGVLLKVPGTFSADPLTGQLTAHFLNNPQFPFSDLKLAFKGGARGLISTPSTCGSFTTAGDLASWASPQTADTITEDPFTISGCGNPNQFSPSFTAGTQNAQAGAYAPFVLSLSRSDSDQTFSGLSVKLPPGMLAKLAGVPVCSDSDASAGTCPAASQVGTVEAGAGPGSEPFFLPGQAYLTGPYKGAPYGLAVVVPAIAGPFNLGTVVVRQALYVDPTTAQVTDVSDPFPTILDGIPLQIRRIDVDLNRPDFTVNPTSCNPMTVTGTLTSTGGMSANVSSRFQVGGCQDIGFSPKLKIALTGKGKTKSGDHPTLTATLTDPAGQANIRSAKVALPLSMALDPNNSQHVCAFATAQAVHGGAVGCPTSTIVGTATTVTPLLSQPLTGNVYLVQGIRTNAQGQQIKTLPTLLVPLRGQIALDLRAQTSVSGGKLVTTFPTIPDAAVSSFTLKINGGKKGLLVVTGRGLNICAKKQVGNADFGAQSGKAHAGNMTLSTPCAKPAKLQVLATKMSTGALTLRVRTSERGKVTVTGQQLAGFSKMLAAGVHQIKVQVKRATTRGSRAKHAASVKVTVQVAPANAMPASKTLTLRL